ncbi:CHASE2 domain-containing protein [Candidatus Woesearchaeota archaeon]|nr:CHASE2 domain-containing protein [Candidatus Woesearchaeota archaeon]
MNKRFYSVIIILGVILILSLGLYAGVGERWDYRLTDTLYGGKAALDNVVILAIDDKSLQEIGRWPWDRKVWDDVFSKLGMAKVVGIDVAFFEESNEESDTALKSGLEKINGIVPVEFTKFKLENGELKGEEILLPIKKIKDYENKAFINVFTDPDSITRSVQTKINEYGCLACEVYRLSLGKETEYNGKLLINFIGKPGSFKTVSITDLLKGREELDLKDRIVFIGATSPDLHDDYFVPTSEGKAMPGVEVHANALQTLINKDYLRHQSRSEVILFICILAVLVGFCLYKFRLLISTIISIVLFALYLVIAVMMFEKGVISNFVYPFLSILFSYLGLTSFYYFTEGKEKAKVRHLFGKYVSHEVADEILKSKEGIDLEGVEKEISILFADIRGFTSLSERLKPKELVSTLNKCLSVMTDSILESKGTLDKYIGDAVMAIFNAPVRHEDHAKEAVQAAVEMVKRVKALGLGVSVGAGVNTGEAVIGNVGSKDRLGYTAIGDSVNLASRVESLNKYYGTSILITESTLRKLGKHNFGIREIDKVAVKGKKEAIMIYEVMIDFDGKLLEIYNKALELYKKAKFKEALNLFSGFKDGVSKLYVERCKGFIKNPPGKDFLIRKMESK